MAGYVAELHHDVRVERRHRDGDDRDDGGSDGHGARSAQRLRQRQRRPRKRAAAQEAHELLGRGRGGLSAEWQNAEETDLTIRSHRA